MYEKLLEYDDFQRIPFHFSSYLLSKLPGLSTEDKKMVSLIFRKQMRDFDLKIADVKRQLMENLEEGELFNKAKDGIADVVLALNDAISRSTLHFSNGFQANATLGDKCWSICAEYLNSKKKTYNVDVSDIRLYKLGMCKERLAYIKIAPSLPGYKPQVSGTCHHNTINALETRFVSEFHEDTKEDILNYNKAHELLADKILLLQAKKGIKMVLMSYEETIDSLDWPARNKAEARRLIPLIENMENTMMAPVSNKIQAFAKFEELKQKFQINSRLIQGYQIGFSLVTARVVKSLYAYFKKLLSDPDNDICMGSAMVGETIGEWRQISDQYYSETVDLDGSAYDATTRRVRVELLYDLYAELIGVECLGLDVLKSAMQPKGSLFTCGVGYSLSDKYFLAGHAPMTSGRADTTLTNTLLRISEGLFYLHSVGAPGRVLASGDDITISTNYCFEEKQIIDLGIVLKRDEKFENCQREDSVFLRKLFMPVNGRLLPGSLAGRVLPRMGWCDAKISAKKRLQVLRGRCLGLLSTDSHNPIIAAYANRFKDVTSKHPIFDKDLPHRIKFVETHEASVDTYAFLSNRYQCSVGDIEELVEYISNCELENEIEHPLMKKIVLIDTENGVPLRDGIVHDPLMGLATAVDQQKFDPLKDNYALYSMFGAPIVEEIAKGALLYYAPDGLIYFLLSILFVLSTLVLVACESMTLYGIHKIDFVARLILHGSCALAGQAVFGAGVIMHSMHNIACFYGLYSPFFFMMSATISKQICVSLTNFQVVLKNFGLFEVLLGEIDNAINDHRSQHGSSPELDNVRHYFLQLRFIKESFFVPTGIMALVLNFFVGASVSVGVFFNGLATHMNGKKKERIITYSLVTFFVLILVFHHYPTSIDDDCTMVKKNNKRGVGPANSRMNKDSFKKAVKAAVKTAMIGGGEFLGGEFGGPAGALIGGKAGALLSRLTGFGDYKIHNNSIVSNGLTFGNDSRNVRVKHHEYLGDVFASSDFRLNSYKLNPGLPGVFTWLSSISDAFQQYRLRGCVFYYRSTSAEWSGNGQSLGTVIMGTNYDVNRPNFSSKLEMENYMFSNSTKPSQNLIHPIECDPRETPIESLYIRNGPFLAGMDPKFYDFANFQIATTGFDSSVDGQRIGELWVAYDVELQKAQYPDGGVRPGMYYSEERLGTSPAHPLGTAVALSPYGNLPLSIGFNPDTGLADSTIFFPNTITGGRFMITISASALIASAWEKPAFTYLNCHLVNWFTSAGVDGEPRPTNFTSPNNGVVVSKSSVTFMIEIEGFNENGSYVACTTGTGLLPGAVVATQVDVICYPTTQIYV